ncbi:unnamed protein product [Cutaneotrichosporon oleaginosum]
MSDEHAHQHDHPAHIHADSHPSASQDAMHLAASMRQAARDHEAGHDEHVAEQVERMNNDHTPEATRVLNEREMPAPAARHALAGQDDLAVPRRFADFSKTPDLFRHTPV